MPTRDDLFYKRYMTSQRWKFKCDLYWKVKGRWCRGCLKKDGPLHVHHLSYAYLGREPLTDLVGLCPKCHREVHFRHRKSGRNVPIRTVTNDYIKEQIMKRNKK